MNSLQSVIDKVQKLLALSKKNANVHESAAAMAAANKLIDEYRLSESQLDSFQEEEILEDQDNVYECSRITSWKSELVCGLAKHYGCCIINKKSYRKNNYKLIGRQSDINIVKYMFSWLILEIDRLSQIASSNENYNKSSGKIFANSFCIGAVRGVIDQLKKSRQDITTSSNLTGIVKLDERYNQSNNFLKQMYNTKKSVSYNKSLIDERAYINGKSKGSNIHLGAGLNAANGVRLLNQ